MRGHVPVKGHLQKRMMVTQPTGCHSLALVWCRPSKQLNQTFTTKLNLKEALGPGSYGGLITTFKHNTTEFQETKGFPHSLHRMKGFPICLNDDELF